MNKRPAWTSAEAAELLENAGFLYDERLDFWYCLSRARVIDAGMLHGHSIRWLEEWLEWTRLRTPPN